MGGIARSSRGRLVLLQASYGVKPSQIWPVVTLASVSLACVTILLVLGVSPVAILAVIGSVATPIIGGVINSKVDVIKEQTNGSNTALLQQVTDLQNHLKTLTTPATIPVVTPVPVAVNDASVKTDAG